MPFHLPPTNLLIIVIVGLVLAGCSNAAEDPPAVNGVGGVGQNAADLPTDLATAQRLEAEGDIETAAEVYRRVAAENSEDSHAAALAATRLLLDQERYEEARLLIEPIAEARSPGESTALYLLARAHSGLGSPQNTADLYEQYILEGGHAAAYAHLDRSYALLELDKPWDAIEAVDAGRGLGVPASRERTFILAATQSRERAGALAEAIEGYYSLIDATDTPGDVAFSLQRIVALKQLLDDETYRDELMRLLVEYPASAEAMASLQEADQAGEAIPPHIRGLVYYRHNEYSLAEPELRQQIEAEPEASVTASAHYYLAAILEARGDPEAALEHYGWVDTLDGMGPLADDALWWRARIHEIEGDLAQAGALYERIVNEHSESDFAADAAFRHGVLPYREGRYMEAATIWEQDAARLNAGPERERLRFWQAKALLEAGQEDEAAAILHSVFAENDGTYLGLRAAGLLSSGSTHPRSEIETEIDLNPDWDWDEAESWLLSYSGATDLDRSWEADERWLRVQELWRVGRDGYAELELYALFNAYSDSPTALYTMARALLEERRITMAARAGVWLLQSLDATPADGLPRAIMSLAYPVVFGDLIEMHAEPEGVSPLLLLALVRQESFFEPLAISPVGALGLAQVMPGTASELAPRLGLTGEPSRSELLQADLNLRMGARYMADQLAGFDAEPLVAIAAYNAGPAAAERWRTAAGDDPDLYFEIIEFDETRHYLNTVAENYAWYRFIYAGEELIGLPR